MTLEFEKLTHAVEQMSQSARGQRQRQQLYVQQAVEALQRFGGAWDAIALCLEMASTNAPPTRLARPFDESYPLDAVIPVSSCPAQATIFATDGSQILPDRHAAYLYYLLNVGSIIYYHGEGLPPTQDTSPSLRFEPADLLMRDQIVPGPVVSARRDLEEITFLAQQVFQNRRETQPLLAVLDQRLLYWPFWPQAADRKERNQIVAGWQQAMRKIKDSDALLAGYIDESRRSSVGRLLDLLLAQEDDPGDTGRGSARWPGLIDSAFYRQLLAPGERSIVFVDVSEDNKKYAEVDPEIEVCFFYLNVAAHGAQIARVDIPRWVANSPQSIDLVHSLLYDQCQIIGGYPYVLARADEVAVVGRQDQDEFERWIDLKMGQFGVDNAMSNKQQTKDLARAGKRRFGE